MIGPLARNDSGTRIGMELNDEVDFCVWILVVDGLQVTPFDRHPHGDGSLRALGLTQQSWRAWGARVVKAAEARTKWTLDDDVASDNEFDEMLARILRLSAGDGPIWMRAMKAIRAGGILVGHFCRMVLGARASHETLPQLDPIEEWSGEDTVRERLAELWAMYKELPAYVRQGGKARARLFGSWDYVQMRRGLWKGSGREHFVFLVNYAEPVRYRMSGTTALLSMAALPMELDRVRAAITETVDWLGHE